MKIASCLLIMLLGTSALLATAFPGDNADDFRLGRITPNMANDPNDGRGDPHIRKSHPDAPLFPALTTGDFTLWPAGGESFSLYGYFDYPFAPLMASRMPLFMHYDYPTQTLFVNHTTTIHYMKGPTGSLPAQSAICLNFNFLGVANWWCFDTSPHYTPAIWAANYQATGVMWSDHDTYKVVNPPNDDDLPRAGDYMRGNVQKWTGTPKDHHVAWPRMVKSVVEKYVNGPSSGLIKSWRFALTFGCGPEPQDFHWEFKTSERRRPAVADLALPSFLPANFSTLPSYALFVANNDCIIGAPTPP